MDRQRKRAEPADALPADKRPCISSPPFSDDPTDGDMDESSDASIDGSDDGNPSSTTFASGGRSKLKQALSGLSSDGAGPGSQLAALTELCELLSLCTEDSIPSSAMEASMPALVQLAGDENNPEIMLLAARALTYICDIVPRLAEAVVRHGALPVICARLLSIEYLDVAEQCLQALEKISRKQPIPCLNAGAIMAVLSYIDFFPISIQRVALSTVANICKKLSADCSAVIMDSVPTLCNLLQYEDRKLVETVATCLIGITNCFCHSLDLLDELCKHGIIYKLVPVISVNGRTSLSQTTYTGLIQLLTKLAGRSLVAVRTLFELNISSSLRNIILDSVNSHDTPCSSVGDKQSSQVHEILKLLNQMIPPLAGCDEDIQLVLSKEKILAEHPKFMHQFSEDILPVSMQVVNSGADMYACYGCVCIINSIVYFNKPDMLLDLLKNTNISSFLAGLLSRKDPHVLFLALKIVENLMRKLPGVFSSSFIKEGVVYAIDAILATENCSPFESQHSCEMQQSSNQKCSSRPVSSCLCHLFGSPSIPSSEAKACKVEKGIIIKLGKQIKVACLTTEESSDTGLTKTLEKLRVYCAVLNESVDSSLIDDECSQNEENLSLILHQIMMEFNGGEIMSNFEFIESGIVKSLAHYLSNGKYIQGSSHYHSLPTNVFSVKKRFQTFAYICLSNADRGWEEMLLTLLLQKLQSALSSFENFPVILRHISKPKIIYTDIPVKHSTVQPCVRIRFLREEEETGLHDANVTLTVEISSSLDAIERYLWPKISKINNETRAEPSDNDASETVKAKSSEDRDPQAMQELSVSSLLKEDGQPLPVDVATKPRKLKVSEFTSNHSPTIEGRIQGRTESPNSNEDAREKMFFFIGGKKIDRSITLFQAILQYQSNTESYSNVGSELWDEEHIVTYKLAKEPKLSEPHLSYDVQSSLSLDNMGFSWQKMPFFMSMLHAELPCKLDKLDPSYDILFLLNILEGLNRFSYQVLSYKRISEFAEGRIKQFDELKVTIPLVPHSEFINTKLSDKLEQQLQDPLALNISSMPSWCSQLMDSFPFIFSFKSRQKYFFLTTFGSRIQQNQTQHDSNNRNFNWRVPRKKFKADRTNILGFAEELMSSHAQSKPVIEVEYNEEVGTGLGPTMEFYTLVSHELQKVGLGMWREDRGPHLQLGKNKMVGDYGFVVAPCGLFPRPWAEATFVSNGVQFSEMVKKFGLLGRLVAKAIKDGRILDIPFSRAFCKVILELELGIYDIESFDPELGRTLLEFHALCNRKIYLGGISNENSRELSDLCFRDTRIEDLCLDFTLPGYTDYLLTPENNMKSLSQVNISNLEEYVSLVVDATIGRGISRQVEAFKSGFNEVFPLKTLQIFSEDELDRLFCGEIDTWNFNELIEHIKFDHGYTAGSPPVINLLEIIQEFSCDQRRAFLQFVTGAPRLPPGGLAALHPKLTIVRKHSGHDIDMDLPSVMTCANYVKLPPYSTKERMRERLLYAITEGQGSFHLS